MEKNKFTILILGCAVLLFLVLDFFGRKDTKNKYIQFNNSTINGRLTSVSLGKGASVIVVGNQKFVFWPNYISNATDFPYFAKKGDSIYKPAKSDTLKLFHNGKVFLYTFEKF